LEEATEYKERQHEKIERVYLKKEQGKKKLGRK
jgi:hypothetical protein